MRFPLASATTYSRIRIDSTAVNIDIIFGEHLWPFVDYFARPIEYTSQHVLCYTKFHALTREPNLGLHWYKISMAQTWLEAFLGTLLTSIPDVPSKTYRVL